MPGSLRALRTGLVLCREADLRGTVLGPRGWGRWLAVWSSGTPGARGAGPLRPTPTRTCRVCGRQAVLVVVSAAGTGADGGATTAWHSYACGAHLDGEALAALTSTGSPVASHPTRRSWRLWWRTAPLGIAWRNAGARVRRSDVPASLEVAVVPRPRGALLFSDRRHLW